jgi:flagellar hook-basal body complex protein FliE
MFNPAALRESPLGKAGTEALQKAGLGDLGKLIPDSEMGKLQPFNKAFPPTGVNPTGIPSLGRVTGRDAFADTLGRFVGEVADKQVAAGDSVRGLVTQQGVPLHQAMIAMEEASVSFQLMVEVRNKLLESYQELMRMQV